MQVAHINPIRKAKVKKALLKGKSAIQALKDAGYTANYATHSTDAKVVKVSMEEIRQEIESNFKLENITVEKVLQDLEYAKQLCIKEKKTKDLSSYIRATELIGKYLAMFTDKIESDNKLTVEEKTERYNRLSKILSSGDLEGFIPQKTDNTTNIP